MYFRYDGAGNDFIVADARHGDAPATTRERADLARILCNREHAAGGADGLLVLEATENPAADVALRIYNADGSEAEMCGNGARCAVVHMLRGPQPLAQAHIVFDTYAGLVRGDITAEPKSAEPNSAEPNSAEPNTAEPNTAGLPHSKAGRSDPADYTVRIDLGTPVFRWDALGAQVDRHDVSTLPESSLHPIVITTPAHEYEIYGASLGNPHVVVFVPDPAKIDLASVGRAIEHHAVFTRGTNVHFVESRSGDQLIVRHWERGSGATQACGTGAVAAATVAIRLGLVQSPVAVDVPGGRLRVEWRGGSARLLGPVRVHGVEGAA